MGWDGMGWERNRNKKRIGFFFTFCNYLHYFDCYIYSKCRFYLPEITIKADFNLLIFRP